MIYLVRYFSKEYSSSDIGVSIPESDEQDLYLTGQG